MIKGDHLIEVRNGEAQPASMRATPGKEIGPISVGTEGAWRVDAAGVADKHCYLFFDGKRLFLQSVRPDAPVTAAGKAVPSEWTSFEPPCEIQFGDARLWYGPVEAATKADEAADKRRPTPPPRPFSPGEFSGRRDDSQVTRLAPIEELTAKRGGTRPLSPMGDGDPTQAKASGAYPQVVPSGPMTPFPPLQNQAPMGGAPLASPFGPPPGMPGGPPMGMPGMGAPSGMGGPPQNMGPTANMGGPPSGMGSPSSMSGTSPFGAPSTGPLTTSGTYPQPTAPPGASPPWLPPPVSFGPGGGGGPTDFAGGITDQGAAPKAVGGGGAWQSLSFAKKATALLLLPAFGAVYVIFFIEPPRAPARPTSSASTSASAPIVATAPVAPPPSTPPVEPPAPAEPAVAAASPKDARGRPRQPPPEVEKPGGPRSPQREAADAVAAGAFERAAKLYDELAAKHPDQPVYAEAAAITRAKAAARK